ncbi:glycosyltransferase family 1 protein [Lusitaniella coriacea LEGE 07157]|uniref:Glycosyltransferase family 1 protein n=1 Tax=Lusitaniella coriacea LEGE 07157 TaxID=945747 RepID=A0A8J7DVD8_9CYAN|nr:glycosyltransferase [Lusitaniella coriacea]MBE9115731.1 glycosyltransferase family 1 protein [Lusitaniella coriacea LEGE 07157]
MLLLSQRKLQDHVSRCSNYEFEDAIARLNDIDWILPEHSYDFSLKIYGLIKRYLRSSRLADTLKPDPNPIRLSKNYPLFFAYFQHPLDILTLNSIKGWRKQCKKAICYLEEIWLKDIPVFQPFLKLLHDFDCIFLGVRDSLAEVERITKRPCTYLPAGIDAVKFCPYPNPPSRCIDVLNMGRRSPMTHNILLQAFEQEKIFYFYDTAKSFSVYNPQEHRTLLSQTIARSRYFIVNRAKVNEPSHIGEQSEFGPRFFEGAAAGAVMLGDYPENETFKHYFDWSDAVIRMPFHTEDILDAIARLDTQPERLAKIRRENIINSLLKHDWVYRWETILNAAELDETPKMEQRKAQLQQLAEFVANDLNSCA